MVVSGAEAYPLTQISTEQIDEMDHARGNSEDIEAFSTSLALKPWGQQRAVNILVKAVVSLVVVGGIGGGIGYITSMKIILS
jgi:hypothetical protein